MSRLIVIASGRTPSISAGESDRVLRLIGMPRTSEVAPDDLIDLAESAAQRMRNTLPAWLWDFARNSGAATFDIFDGPVGAWWYLPVSEMSPQRTGLLRELYWLTLVKMILESGRFASLLWCGDDSEIAELVRNLAESAGVKVEVDLTPVSHHSLRRSAGARLLFGLRDLLLWIVMRLAGFAAIPAAQQPDSIFYTRFPVLWEISGGTLRERMYAAWPDHLELRGHRIIYLAAYSGRLRDLVLQCRVLLRQTRAAGIVFALTQVSLTSLLRAHFSPRVLLRYRSWRRRARPTPIVYEGLSVERLLWRELDRDALSFEVPHDRLLSDAIAALTARCTSIRDVYYPFEFQPTERALAIGAKRSRDCRAIGLQTGLFTSNQFGFLFPAALVRRTRDDASRAPMPDVLAAYGDLPYEIFARNLGADRVVLSGPIRYPTLVRIAAQPGRPTSDSHVAVLVTTSTIREESIPLIEASFAVAKKHPEVSLTFRFHYHLLLHDEVKKAAAHWGVDRFRFGDGSLHEEMRRSTAMVSGGSSTGIEAIALGCMPLVYRTVGRMAPNPMNEVPDALFFWQTPDDLERALTAVIRRDAEYEHRRQSWPGAIRAHLGSSDRDPNECLYQFLYGT